MSAGTIFRLAHLDACDLQYWMVHFLRMLPWAGNACSADLHGPLL